MHAEFLACLERARSLNAHIVPDELRGCAEGFLARRWIVADGHQTSILVPVLDGEDEVEVAVDDERRTFSYCSPSQPGRIVTRPLADITLYAFNVDAWLDAISDILEVEHAHRARRREIVDGHLWHLGNLRVGRSHQFAPVYAARRLARCAEDWRKPLFDAMRPGHGIVLTCVDLDTQLPNGHQQCGLDSLLTTNVDGTLICDRDVLDRLLRGVPADAADPDEWFDERGGELKLVHMSATKVFKGKQKAVIAAFWKARHQASLKWSDVITLTDCGRDPDSVFGKLVWREWLENVGHGHYRIRSRRPQK